MAQNGPGKPNKPAEDGFNDTAGDGPAEDPPSSWLETGEAAPGMFADTASSPDAPGYEVRTVESDVAEDVGLQDRARDASADADADAYAEEPAGPDVEPPALAEAADAPDPYEFKDDGSAASSWVDSEPVRSWTPEDDLAPSPDLLTPDAEPPLDVAPRSSPPPAAKPPRPAAAPPRPPAPRPSGGLPRPAPPAQTAPRTPSGPVKPPAATPAPRATAPAPAKPLAPRPAATTPAPKPAAPAPKPAAPTPKPGKKGGFDIDNLFQRAKDIKKDVKDDKKKS